MQMPEKYLVDEVQMRMTVLAKEAEEDVTLVEEMLVKVEVGRGTVAVAEKDVTLVKEMLVKVAMEEQEAVEKVAVEKVVEE